MRIFWFFIWRNLNPYHPRMLVRRLIEIGSVVLEKRNFLISSMYFRYFVIISPWKRAEAFIWTNLNPLQPMIHCAKFGWKWPGGFGGEDFLISSMYFRYFVIISPWKRAGPFIWINLNLLHPKMLRAKTGWNWPSGSREEDFLISSMYFRCFLIISPWKRAESPTFEHTWIPFIPSMLCAKFGWNWTSGSCEEDFWISAMYFRYFDIIFPWQRAGPFILTKLNPLLCAKFGWNWPSASGEENLKSVRTDRQTDRRTTDDRRSEKLTWAFSSVS